MNIILNSFLILFMLSIILPFCFIIFFIAFRVGIHKVHNEFPTILKYWRPKALNRNTNIDGSKRIVVYKWMWFWFTKR